MKVASIDVNVNDDDSTDCHGGNNNGNYNNGNGNGNGIESWINRKWRPVMGWTYMAICIFDFIIAPIFWSLVQVYGKGVVSTQWDPITLKGAGLFHVAMGAILGITAWSRGQEKMRNAQSSLGMDDAK